MVIKMKKIITLLTMFLFMIGSVSGLVQYTGSPGLPYIIYGHVEWNDQPLSSARLEITNAGTGYTKQIVTNGDGYWQVDAQNWLTSFSGRPPVMFGDSISVEVTDGCGVGDTCKITFSAYSDSYKDYGIVDLSVTGNMICPPLSCPSCGGCGGGGGGSYSGGGGFIREVESDCPACITDTCPPKEVCPENSCPPRETCLIATMEECNSMYPSDDCPIVPEGLTPGQGVVYLISIISFGIGGYFAGKKLTAGEINLIKNVTYRTAIERDGDIREEHRHPGLRQFHSINTSHREANERHPKGEKFPRYEKDEAGVYNYIPKQ